MTQPASPFAFVDGALDRADHLRDDPAALDALRHDARVIVLDEDEIETWRKRLPELPNKRRIRYMKDYGLPEFDAGLLATDPERAAFFEACIQAGSASPKATCSKV